MNTSAPVIPSVIVSAVAVALPGSCRRLIGVRSQESGVRSLTLGFAKKSAF